MVKQQGDGLTSSAGLMRYFDEESTETPIIGPKQIMVFSAVLGVLILSLNLYYGLWP
ncbi:preprotein translocase subunit Sec61beta [Methanonatronarchaeum sp. AMET-Sl]|uniref:preprotein translocase subunit Sec61beta n=1 Tax=Methanonatronarchaeum sp. AMET-Sl TaxID=3037654 RepID=UPI00244E4B46|nr:preprotein translocase subunit Sec61beta [Methanonatronarchaeum sp. AMET-Sl]WGI17363.1 preprotein translocase subunit Sec61beta [Methanonatronarchaeum sp. AMET-Sl]